jgi:uncharacterized iron-regulated membrane protein
MKEDRVESVAANPEKHVATVTRRANWLRSPQRVWLRRAIFQIHLWLGLIVALYCVIIGLSGSALVFKGEIEHATQAQVHHLAPTPRTVALEQTVRSIEAGRPGWIASGLKDFEKKDEATTVLMRQKTGAPDSNYRMVSFNPYTGAVLLDRMRYDGVLGWICNLHFYLLSGKIGLQISGWMSAGLLLLCISGLVVWWPGVQRWAGAMVLRLHGRNRINWKRLNWDLHSVVGFWSCAALFAVTFTGLYFAFPSAVGAITVMATGGSPAKAMAQMEAKDRKPVASSAPAMTLDQVIAAARRALPENAPPNYLYLPGKPGVPYSVTGYYNGSLPYSQLVRVSLDPHTGEVLGKADTMQQMLGLRVIQYFFTVHFGSFGGDGWIGAAVKIIWVLVGLVPVLLAVTGLFMYWNRKLKPLWLRIR